MNFIKQYKLAFLVTNISFILLFCFSSVWLHALLMMIVTIVWAREARIKHAGFIDHQKMIKRIESLNDFSDELKAVINEELMLVQNDVIRMREIVSDSIGLLQESFMGIQRQFSALNAKVNSLAVTDENHQLSKDEKVKQYSENLNSINEQMQLLCSYINNFEEIADKANALANKANTSEVNENDINDNIMSVCKQYSQLSQKTKQQYIISNQCITQMGELVDSISKIDSGSAVDQSRLNVVEIFKGSASDNKDIHVEEVNWSVFEDAIRALQFEDIVGQLSERIARHIEGIRGVANILSSLSQSETSPDFNDLEESMRKNFSDIKDNLKKESDNKTVEQKNMDEGSVDLF